MGRFDFKQFSLYDTHCAMKIGTDAVLLGSWVSIPLKAEILDAGCGSGILALMAAQRSPTSRIIAIDIDPAACDDARRNVAASPWQERIEVRCCDLTEGLPPLGSPRLILSNPPFFHEELRSGDRARALARHGEGFDVRMLIELCYNRLTSACDSVAFISPADREGEIEFLLELKRLSVYRKTHVYSREGKAPYRILWQAGCDAALRPQKDVLTIRDKDNNYTSDYIQLTSEFYEHLS